MGKQQSGFTLIELIAVIVILGILAATAVPKFINLQDEAAAAALLGVAGALESGSAMNHAIDIATEAGLTSDAFVTIDTCDDAAGLLSGGLPAGYSLDAAELVADHTAATCTLTSSKTSPATTKAVIIVGALP